MKPSLKWKWWKVKVKMDQLNVQFSWLVIRSWTHCRGRGAFVPAAGKVDNKCEKKVESECGTSWIFQIVVPSLDPLQSKSPPYSKNCGILSEWISEGQGKWKWKQKTKRASWMFNFPNCCSLPRLTAEQEPSLQQRWPVRQTAPVAAKTLAGWYLVFGIKY